MTAVLKAIASLPPGEGLWALAMGSCCRHHAFGAQMAMEADIMIQDKIADACLAGHHEQRSSMHRQILSEDVRRAGINQSP
jgi:hypothetical protein